MPPEVVLDDTDAFRKPQHDSKVSSAFQTSLPLYTTIQRRILNILLTSRGHYTSENKGLI